MTRIITFQEIWPRVLDAVHQSGLSAGSELWILRDLFGRISVLLSSEEVPEPVSRLLERLSTTLGAHAYPPDRGILFLEPEALKVLQPEAVTHMVDGVKIHLVDREITHADGRPFPICLARSGLCFSL